KAGGYGVLGALAYSPDQLEVELSWIDEHVDGKPYGVDFAMPEKFVGKGEEFDLDSLQSLIPEEHRQFVEKILAEHDVPPMPEGAEGVMKAAGLGVEAEGPGQVDVALSHPVSMLVNALGPPPEYVVEAAHSSGVLVGALCGSPRHAQRNVERGVDVLIAQGTEAGGHCGEISTMVLVPEVVDTVGPDVPVLAAGGIGRGRQMAAAIALGAQGAWTGSIWLTVTESETQPWVIENLLAAGFTDTVRSRAMTGKPARQLRTDWTNAWDSDDTPDPLPMPLQGLLYAPAAHRFMRVRSRALSGSPVGQIIGRVDRVRPAKDVVYDIVEEWIETTQRMCGDA
ncbi:MAG TPA: nitronate monooxygenase family protein, partial [Acidimicrobiia bacterium]|nr:nitronate monooxygenase family protein [Acidimicrobiia bacterium]